MSGPIWGYTIRYVENSFGSEPTSHAAGGGSMETLWQASEYMLVKCEELARRGYRIIWARVDDARLVEHW